MRFSLSPLDLSPLLVIALAVTLHVSLKSKRLLKPAQSQGATEHAFATLATPAFCMGTVAIGHTLRKLHGEKYDLICLVTPDVNDTWVTILSQWWRVIQVPNYKPYPAFRRSWAKLHLWDRTEYRKIVYLDTDLVILGNLDELFEYSMLSCVSDSMPPQICNTGVMVIEPGQGLFAEMKAAVIARQLFQGVGDQGFINAFFDGFTALHPKYNIPRTQTPGLGRYLRVGKAKIVHMVCKKPWKCGREGVSYCGCGYPSLNQLWWDIWDEACKNHLCMETWKEGK
jgi:glycogenin glucosyltransferase